MTPTVLVDMDGPLADFDRQFFDTCAAKGWPLDCTLDTQRHRFATDHIPDPKHRSAARSHVNTTRWFRDLPPAPGAIDGIRRLHQAADVWIVTKPLEANHHCRDDKAAWIRKHLGAEWEPRLIIAADKSIVRGTILLDDAPHPAWFERAIWEPVVYPTPWNGDGSKWAGLPRWSWDQTVADLFDLLAFA